MIFRRKFTCLGRSGILYRRKKMKLRLNADFHSCPLGVIVFRDGPWRWDPPHDQIEIDHETQEVILEELSTHFEKRGYEVQIR
jgi:hypothetical protein